MGWNHLYTSWKANLPSSFTDDQTKVLDALIHTVVDPILKYVRSECAEETPTQDQNLIVSCLKIMRVLMKPFEDENFYNQYDKK
jgi:hypothetical protein